MRPIPKILCGALAAVLCAPQAAAWDSKIHPGIVRAALSAIPPEDRLREKWGAEIWRLQQYVQLGDWINALVVQREEWHVGGETLELPGLQFYANDFLIFPGATRPFQHMAPDVQAAYRPFFLRALQALRMESPENAARWVGSLLHFVTDSGSPPHAIGVRGPDHTRMESGFDTARIDLTGYRPKPLGETPEAALNGLIDRMNALIAFSAIRGKQMVPYAPMNDRSRLDGPALESASETARVTADTIHTLLHLANNSGSAGASLIAEITAPAIDGLENLPAKIMFPGTEYSTLSTQSPPEFGAYRGVFSLRSIPPGTYSIAVERPGSEPLRIAGLVLKAGQPVHANWKLSPSDVSGNMALNPHLELRWVTKDAPDHWHSDTAKRQWISDNIPVTAGREYRAGCERKAGASAGIELQWMSHAWEVSKIPPESFSFSQEARAEKRISIPANAMFARFVVHSSEDPSTLFKSVFVAPLGAK